MGAKTTIERIISNYNFTLQELKKDLQKNYPEDFNNCNFEHPDCFTIDLLYDAYPFFLKFASDNYPVAMGTEMNCLEYAMNHQEAIGYNLKITRGNYNYLLTTRKDVLERLADMTGLKLAHLLQADVNCGFEATLEYAEELLFDEE